MSGILTIPDTEKYDIKDPVTDTAKAGEALDFGDAVVSVDGGDTYDYADSDGEAGTQGIVRSDSTKDSYESGDQIDVLIGGWARANAQGDVNEGDKVILDSSNDGDVKADNSAELSQVLGKAKTGISGGGEIIVRLI